MAFELPGIDLIPIICADDLDLEPIAQVFAIRERDPEPIKSGWPASCLLRRSGYLDVGSFQTSPRHSAAHYDFAMF